MSMMSNTNFVVDINDIVYKMVILTFVKCKTNYDVDIIHKMMILISTDTVKLHNQSDINKTIDKPGTNFGST